jgi:hypothetical protein
MLDLEDGKGVVSTVSKILISYLDDLSDMQDVPDMPISANVSEASHSSQDLMTARPAELATERTPHASPSFSDDPDRVKSMDRPVSLPPTTEVKPEPSIMAVRQSMPAPIAGLVSRKVRYLIILVYAFAYCPLARPGIFRARTASKFH